MWTDSADGGIRRPPHASMDHHSYYPWFMCASLWVVFGTQPRGQDPDRVMTGEEWRENRWPRNDFGAARH